MINWFEESSTRRPPVAPTPPAEPVVRVKATRANWCMHGVPVVVGHTYELPRSNATTLIHLGKAAEV
jgi:hypothetical protein